MQIPIDFTGKKTARITFAADDDLKQLLENVAKKLKRPMELGLRSYRC